MNMFRPSYWEQTTFFRSPDVVVIGAGLTGLQAALALKQANPKCDVLVVERAAVPRGASTRNAGFACFGGPTELLADMDAYGAASTLATVRERFAGILALERDYSQRNIGWRKHGGYEVIDDKKTAEMVSERLPELNALLAEVTELKDTWSVVADSGWSGSIKLSLHNRLEAQLHPGKLVSLLLEDCHRAGVRFLFGCQVDHVGATAGAVTVEGAGWGRVDAKQALVTVNAFARDLLPAEFPESIRPVRNQILLSDSLPDFKLRGCYHYHEGYVYFRNVGKDRMLIGGARHRAGEASETDVFGPNGVPEAFLIDKLNEWFPERKWTDADFPTRWSGIIAQGDGKSPVLRYANNNVLVAGRLAGMGVALSAALASRAAKMISES
ncbi:FAD-binding oxidoreductase [Neolewinella aurantiaca]|uniref:FAD-binding oxidoreductase n=1 Tax=Neolewinella aurantiaca TaxID=2602767 RepID=A0A5C7G0Z1_9BACT|nr:FAD-dependent oxidoreductase [Neolewinella aurantiaca]TXF91429.1 FAD-binding oxidoreductase [Neolewinella aurantiaca]